MTPVPDFPNELVEAAAKALAGEPRCYCPDDWRADPSPRCPFHGDGEWPTYAHYLQARAVLAAVLPPIEQRVIDRLAGTENPYAVHRTRDDDGKQIHYLHRGDPADGESGIAHRAWSEGVACGVAAERARTVALARAIKRVREIEMFPDDESRDADYGPACMDLEDALSAALAPERTTTPEPEGEK